MDVYLGAPELLADVLAAEVAAPDEDEVGVGVDPEEDGMDEEGSVEGARPREARFPMALSELPLLDAEGARSRASVPPAAPSAKNFRM